MTAPERVFVGLGANLGDASDTVLAAVQGLRALPGTQVVALSSLYRSAPLAAQGPDFINAVAELATLLEPLALLGALQALEHAHGRQRPYPNAPRTLDLDLLLFGQRVLDTPRLHLPHPRLHQRAFVLQPLLELDPGLCHPVHGPMALLLPGTAAQGIERLEGGRAGSPGVAG